MIKFTVVTCTYNAESVLQRTLDSVNKQTYCNIEHLIIDGVSKDKTLAMVRAYQNRAKAGENAHEIVVYSEPDKGLYDAMNKGIDHATGDYLVFLNAGDVFPSDDTLEAICKYVMKGDPRKPAYFRWFSLAVQRGLRITRLYEYYMETMDISYRRQLPKPRYGISL